MNLQAVEDWLRLRRELLDMESEFTTLAIKVTEGAETEETLRQQRAVLQAQRELCAAAYERAFPSASNSAPWAKRATMTAAIRVAIVDDHLIVRQGMREYLAQFPDIQWVGDAADGVAGLALVEGTPVDVLLLDLAMPRKNGLELLPEVRARCPATELVVLSGYPESHYADQTNRLGAAAYLHKECDPLAIVAAIRQAASRADPANEPSFT